MILNFIASFLLLFSFIPIQDKSPFEGKWVDSKLKISYEFRSDGSILFEQNGMPALVDSWTFEDGEPMKASFVMKQGAMSLTIPALIQVVDDKTLWIEQFAPGEQPSEFSDRPYQMHVLKKVD